MVGAKGKLRVVFLGIERGPVVEQPWLVIGWWLQIGGSDAWQLEDESFGKVWFWNFFPLKVTSLVRVLNVRVGLVL